MSTVISITRKTTVTRKIIRQETPNHPTVTQKPKEYWEQLELDLNEVS
jgi:hypothetical protein